MSKSVDKVDVGLSELSFVAIVDGSSSWLTCDIASVGESLVLSVKLIAVSSFVPIVSDDNVVLLGKLITDVIADNFDANVLNNELVDTSANDDKKIVSLSLLYVTEGAVTAFNDCESIVGRTVSAKGCDVVVVDGEVIVDVTVRLVVTEVDCSGSTAVDAGVIVFDKDANEDDRLRGMVVELFSIRTIFVAATVTIEVKFASELFAIGVITAVTNENGLVESEKSEGQSFTRHGCSAVVVKAVTEVALNGLNCDDDNGSSVGDDCSAVGSGGGDGGGGGGSDGGGGGGGGDGDGSGNGSKRKQLELTLYIIIFVLLMA